MKPTVGIFNDGFPQEHWSNIKDVYHVNHGIVDVEPPKFFNWERKKRIPDGITIYTDHEAPDVRHDNVSKYKVLWMIEPPLNQRALFKHITQEGGYHDFDMIFTSNTDLLKLDSRFRWCPFGTCWISACDQGIHKKNENVSIIVSHQTWMPGHKMRHGAIKAFHNKIDKIKHGHEWRPKIEYLRDFRYSIVTENQQVPGYFSEKLLDCFKTGTIPIYWGCPNLGDYFHTDGIHMFNDYDELGHILKNVVSEDDYKSRRNAIVDNYMRADIYIHQNEWFWNNGLNELCK
jgi:hypothetical protein